MSQGATELSVPIKYHPAQNKLFFQSSARVKVAVKGRRLGLTRGVSNLYCENAFEGLSPQLWVDTVNGNIDRYVERYFYPVLKNIPTKYWTWRQQKKELDIFGRRVDFRSADQPERIEGFAYRYMFLNEAGIILRNESLFYNSISPMMLDFKPNVIIGGTPKGKGLFHSLAMKAKSDEPKYKDWEYFHFTSFDNPFLTAADIEELSSDWPEVVRRQEIYAEFLDDASSVFRNVGTCAVAAPRKSRPLETYKLGVDLARLVDYTVIVVLDSNGDQVYIDRFTETDWRIQKERIKNVSKAYNNAEVWLDSTGIGDPIYSDLADAGLNVKGYKITNESKKQLIQALMLAFEQEKIKIFSENIDGPQAVHAKSQLNELYLFGYEMTSSGLIRYNAPEGHHDDCVTALALANWGIRQGGGVGIAVATWDVRPD